MQFNDDTVVEREIVDGTLRSSRSRWRTPAADHSRRAEDKLLAVAKRARVWSQPCERKEFLVFADLWARLIGVTRRAATAPLRILIVDDDPATCAFVDRVLREDGFITAIAFDGPEALAKAKDEGPFDLLLTDEQMPQWKGHQLVSEIRRLDPNIKVLYLTGYSDLLFAERGTLWEGEAFVDKPVTPRALREAIALLLARG